MDGGGLNPFMMAFYGVGSGVVQADDFGGDDDIVPTQNRKLHLNPPVKLEL